jgi:hypothetical protein
MAQSKHYGVTGLSTNVELGKGGPRLKNNSGVVEHRNSADSAFVIVRGAHPIGENDLVTKRYLEERADVRVTGQIDGGSPPAVVAGAVYIVTTAGGSYSLKELYYGGATSWEAITVLEGMRIGITDALTGGTDEYLADRVYMWDADGATWVNVGPLPSIPGMVRHERVTIGYTDTGDNNLGSAVPNAGIAEMITVNVTQAFNGTTPQLKIGDSGDDDRHMTIDEVDLETVGKYVVHLYHKYGSSTQVVANLAIGGSPTAGQCDVVMNWAQV